MNYFRFGIVTGFCFLFTSAFICCKADTKTEVAGKNQYDPIKTLPEGITIPKGMVWIPGGHFIQGALVNDSYAMTHEKPSREIILDGFFMDTTEVTNKEFMVFIKETGYITTAERPVDWEILKLQLPENTPKPHDSLLKPGSLVFKKSTLKTPQHYSEWWSWKNGVNWKHPYGPESSIIGRENEPVVHISYQDAIAYCKWKGRRLPTEAEWEYAASGGNKKMFSWGNDVQKLNTHANTWQGIFPIENTEEDGYLQKAPVASFPPNAYGLYDMIGNVWEWTQDWYHPNSYKLLARENNINPTGIESSTKSREKVIKGGSYLCNINYCASYRISARMASSYDSSLEHLGFRTVISITELKNEK